MASVADTGCLRGRGGQVRRGTREREVVMWLWQKGGTFSTQEVNPRENFIMFSPVEGYCGGHFITFSVLGGQLKGDCIMFSPMERHPGRLFIMYYLLHVSGFYFFFGHRFHQ